MAERRRPLEIDDGQGELFAGDAFAPVRPWDERERDAGAPGREAGATERRAPEAAATEAEVAAPTPDAAASEAAPDPHALSPGTGAAPTEVPSHDELVTGEELAGLEQVTVAADDVRSPRSPRAPLAGPTLDDVMSRVWEGLVTGLPAACPICHGEVVPSIHGSPHGRCTSCGTSID